MGSQKKYHWYAKEFYHSKTLCSLFNYMNIGKDYKNAKTSR